MKLTGILSTLRLTDIAHPFRRCRTPMPSSVELLEGRCLLAAGEFDTSFGDGGVTSADDRVPGAISSVAVQHDGKIVVAGVASATGDSDFRVSRFHPDGQLDASFGINGIVTTTFSGPSSAASIAIQQDGKLVVAGFRFDGVATDVALARYNPDGSLDQDFGELGLVTTDVGTTDDAIAVAIQADGKILTFGSSFESSSSEQRSLLVRYNDDGNLDTEFGDGGIVLYSFGGVAYGHDMVIGSDGKIVVVAEVLTGDQSSFDFGFARYTSDGHLDSSFGNGGTVVTDFGSVSQDTEPRLVLGRGGEVIAAGTVLQDGNQGIGVIRLTSNGRIADRFEITSDAISSLSSLRFTDIAIQNDQKLLISGYLESTDTEHALLMRVNRSGSLDTTFGNEGVVTDGLTGSYFSRNTIQLEGKIIVASSVSDPESETFASFMSLSRYLGDVTAFVALPPTGISYTAVLENGLLHLRTRKGNEVIDPIPVSDKAIIHFDGSVTADRVTLHRSFSEFRGTITFSGHDGKDLFDAKSVSSDIVFDGGDGNDTFLGGGGHDSAFGGSGNDSLVGAGGDDFLDGGADKDRLKGDAGNDLLIGDSGNDSLRGGTGHDTLLGETGRDTLQGEDGDDVLDGGDDEDFIVGSAGNDSMRGGNGKDTLYGGAGADLLIGSSGNDYLFGDSGDDSLLGDNGDDQIFGGTGLDLINPGIGRDGIHDSRRVIDLSFTFDFDALIAGLV